MTVTQVEVEATTQRPVEPTRVSSVGEVKIVRDKFGEKILSSYAKISKQDHKQYHTVNIPHVHMGGTNPDVMLRRSI